MIQKIKRIHYKGKYTYQIQFENNLKADIDFQPFLW